MSALHTNRILLVEDDAAARMVTAHTLQGAGYTVATADSGEAAIELLQQHTYAVIISDIRMGMVDGVAVLQAARTQPYKPEVILLTGYGSLETSLAALRRGAYDYLLKPCNPDTLLQTVARAIEHRQEIITREDAMNTILQIASRVQISEAPGNMPEGSAEKAPANESGRYLRVGVLTIDYFRHEVQAHGKPLHMTRIEYLLLCSLAEAQGRVLSYREIVKHTHGQEMDDADALLLLKQHIRNIRSKIPADYLINVRSTGYMLVDPTADAEPTDDDAAG
jgi:DNA-binding response OmpR family regulator